MSSNVSTVTLTDGRIVLLSYGRPVATYWPVGSDTSTKSVTFKGVELHFGQPATVQAEQRHYSRTTTRHINAFARQHGALIETVDEQTFNAAIAPLAR